MNNGFYEFSRGKQQVTSSVFPYTGSAIISGSLQVTGSILSTQGFTGSLFGTSSWAENSISSSFATISISSSFSTSSSFAVSSSRAVTSSFAISASWAPSQTIDTSSLVTTSSFNSFTSSYNTGSFTGSFTGAFTGSLFGTASRAISASFAVSGGNQNLQQVLNNGSTAIDKSVTLTNTTNNVRTFIGSEGFSTFNFITNAGVGGSVNNLYAVSGTNSTVIDYTSVIVSTLDNLTTLSPGALSYVPTSGGSTSITFTNPTANNNLYFPDKTGTIATLDDIPNTSSFVVDSTFNAFTSSYNTGSFTGSFTGDGSGLTNLPVQSIDTSSFATTGSNTFIGNQVITGSLTVTQDITGSLFGTASWANNVITASFAQGGNGSFSGSFSGSGANLNSIPASAIVGLTTTQIATGSVTASVSPTQFTVTSGSSTELVVTGTGITMGNVLTDTHRITGSLNVTGSLTTIGTISGSTVYSSGDITAQNNLRSLNSAGDEGGEIFLNVPVTNTAITGGLTLDVYQNRFRIFEQGGTNRGGYYDITALAAGASTNLLATSSATTTGLLSSTDWTSFNGRKKKVVSDTTSVTVTNTTSLTLVKTYEITVGTLPTSGILDLFMYSTRTGTSAIHTMGLYINTTNNFATATLIGTATTGGNFTPILPFKATYVLKNNLLIGGIYTGTTGANYVPSSTQTSVACNNSSASVWFFVGVTPSNTGQTVDFQGIEIVV